MKHNLRWTVNTNPSRKHGQWQISSKWLFPENVILKSTMEQIKLILHLKKASVSSHENDVKTLYALCWRLE